MIIIIIVYLEENKKYKNVVMRNKFDKMYESESNLLEYSLKWYINIVSLNGFTYVNVVLQIVKFQKKNQLMVVADFAVKSYCQ